MKYALALLAMTTVSIGAAAQGLTLIDLPPNFFASASGITAEGDVVGGFGAYSGGQGFLLDNTNQLTLIDVPGAIFTDAHAINNRGHIVGMFEDSSYKFRGFTRTPEGPFRTIDSPACVSSAANGINDAGVIVGWCIDDSSESSPVRGFTWSDGAFGFFSVPGATSTYPTGISNDGTIVGYFGSGVFDDPRRGFILRDGSWTFVDYPNATSTFLLGIGAGETIVGFADAPGGVGFVLRNGEFMNVGDGVVPSGVNASGTIVGSQNGQAIVWREFLAPLAPVRIRFPIADAFVRDGIYASRNFGRVPTLDVKKGASPDNTERAYLKFDVAGVRPNDRIRLRLSERLEFDSVAAIAPTLIYAVSDTSWDEQTLTWITRPDLGDVLASVTATGTAPQTFDIDLTNYVQREKRAGRDIVSVALRNPTHSSAAVRFVSREGGVLKPRLLVTARQSQ